MSSISVRQAISPSQARSFDTAALRENFLVGNLFSAGEIRMTYSHLDRMVIGGATPDGNALELKTSKPIGSAPFLKRRELGIFNIGGPGAVCVDGKPYDLDWTDCLYVSSGAAEVVFSSHDGARPARFYFVSTPAHRACETRVIRKADAMTNELGSQSDANRRVLRQYIHPDRCDSCQLLMGVTTLDDGSIWNTMPCHTHDRRSEAYLYFDLAPEARVFHFMGEPEETRHLVLANEQAVLSPGWSIHCGAGTGRYGFIWAMAGDNQDFTDMDMVAMDTLR